MSRRKHSIPSGPARGPSSRRALSEKRCRIKPWQDHDELTRRFFANVQKGVFAAARHADDIADFSVEALQLHRDRLGSLWQPKAIECADFAHAVEKATAMLDGQFGELWVDDRLIIRLAPRET
jgi:hypothetical protein